MQNTYIDLNAKVNLWGPDGGLQLDSDKQAARAYFLEHVNPNTVFFHTLLEKTEYLVDNDYWDEDVVNKFGFAEFKRLFQYAYSYKFRFTSFMGAFKFYTSYALKTYDGARYLERFEDRVVMTAIAYASNIGHAERIIEAIITRRFQPATPTFLNAGRANAGGPTSCYLMRVEDNMESIMRSVTDSGQLSKRGGGVALLLSNLREQGAPIKRMENQSSGVVPVMKIFEDIFSYANQLGQRSGAGAVYLHAHHPDIMGFLDTKRENADEKVRIKTLSLGVVIPDITFELAAKNEDMYLFSPYDVERFYGIPFSEISVTEKYQEMVNEPSITKTKVKARKFFQTLAEIQFESGYPYIMYEDTANAANPAPNVGRISQSNLCSEILQPSTASTFKENGEYLMPGRDISCNLGSLNVGEMDKLRLKDKEHFGRMVEAAYDFLTNVAISGDKFFESSPSIQKGNLGSRAIGLGQMNLHGYLIELGIAYDSVEARDLFQGYIEDVTFEIISASNTRAESEGISFDGFDGSRWQDGSYIQSMYDNLGYQGNRMRTPEEWLELQSSVTSGGLYNMHLQAIPPTGSISYINGATPSIHPIAAPVEVRKEGKTGRIYHPAPGMTNENFSQVRDAYQIGPDAVIDMYAAVAPFIDQGMSLTLFFPDSATTRDVNRAQIRAHRAELKSIYYIRIRQQVLEGTEMEECVSCQL